MAFAGSQLSIFQSGRSRTAVMTSIPLHFVLFLLLADIKGAGGKNGTRH